MGLNLKWQGREVGSRAEPEVGGGQWSGVEPKVLGGGGGRAGPDEDWWGGERGVWGQMRGSVLAAPPIIVYRQFASSIIILVPVYTLRDVKGDSTY